MTDTNLKPESASEREFWLDIIHQERDGTCGEVYWSPKFTDLIHVIEKSAYDRQEKTISELIADLKRADRANSRYLSAYSLFVESINLKAGDCGIHERCLNELRKLEDLLEKTLARTEVK